MEIKCYNPKCLHQFNYTGKKFKDSSTITCPSCRYKLRIGKAKRNTLPHEIPHEVTLPHSVPHALPHEIPSNSKSEIPEIPSLYEEKEFTNIADFNLEIDRNKLVEIKEIKSNLEIKQIPLSPVDLARHQEEYARGPTKK